MSLIATTFSETAPFMIGDLLFSSKRGKEDFVSPTGAEIGKSDPSLADQLNPDELFQKVYILNDHACIALAGWEDEMKGLLVYLRKKVSKVPTVTHTIMDHWLKQYDLSANFPRSVFMIFVIEKEENEKIFFGRFKLGNWINIDHPVLQSIFACGSGARTFIEYMREPFTYVSTFPDGDYRNLLTPNLIMVANWLTTEKVAGITLEEDWGCGYEIIYFDGERFRKFDEIAFVIFETKMENDGSMQRMHPSVINYYRYHGDILFLYSFRLYKGMIEEDDEKITMTTEFRDYESRLFIVGPIDAPEGTIVELPADHSFTTRHVAAGMAVWYENGHTFRPGSYLEARDVGLQYTMNGKLEVTLSVSIHNDVEANALAAMNAD
jgi:hypothetical protein